MKWFSRKAKYDTIVKEIGVNMSSGLMSIPRPKEETLSYDKAAVLSPADQFNALVVAWNAAYVLSKAKPNRDMMFLRAKGQGGTFDTEPQAVEARIQAAANLSDVDYVTDVLQGGLGAFQTLTVRANNPFGGAVSAVPDLSKPPLPSSYLASGGDQPFVEWGSHTSEGVACWDALVSDKTEVGSTWTGVAKHASVAATYVKVRDYPWGVIRDRYFVQK